MTYIIFYIPLSSVATNMKNMQKFYDVILLAINIVLMF